MKLFKTVISIFMLALLVFPLAEKTIHEAGHFEEEHCSVKDTHFCSAEHNCEICDYLFSTSCALPADEVSSRIWLNESAYLAGAEVFSVCLAPGYSVPLRGPPLS